MIEPKTELGFDTDMISAEVIVAARPFELVEGITPTPVMESVFETMRNDLVENILLSRPEYNDLHEPGTHIKDDTSYEDQLRDYRDCLGQFGIPDERITAQFESDLEDIQCRLDTLVVKGKPAVERLPHAKVDTGDTHSAISLLKKISAAEPELLRTNAERTRMNDAIELLQAIEQRLGRPDDSPPHYRPGGNNPIRPR